MIVFDIDDLLAIDARFFYGIYSEFFEDRRFWRDDYRISGFRKIGNLLYIEDKRHALSAKNSCFFKSGVSLLGS